METKIAIYSNSFDFNEKNLLNFGKIKVNTFKYSSGVCAIRVITNRGEIIFLPFLGQQIWRCKFDNRELTMKSTFDEPIKTEELLKTYGAFLVHCGISGMGNPSKDDNHNLHGELPCAKYNEAYIITGVDNKGKYIKLGGVFKYNYAYEHKYEAKPDIKIYENESIIEMNMKVLNQREREMELMYMTHINFIPEDKAKIIYSEDKDKDIVVYNQESDDKKLINTIEELKINPNKHQILSENEHYNPEIVLNINYALDENNEGHTIMEYSDGSGAYVKHNGSNLPYGIRWISRTKDEDAIGICLPATAEHLGYLDAKNKGNIVKLKGKEEVKFSVSFGLLDKKNLEVLKEKIKKI